MNYQRLGIKDGLHNRMVWQCVVCKKTFDIGAIDTEEPHQCGVYEPPRIIRTSKEDELWGSFGAPPVDGINDPPGSPTQYVSSILDASKKQRSNPKLICIQCGHPLTVLQARQDNTRKRKSKAPRRGPFCGWRCNYAQTRQQGKRF